MTRAPLKPGHAFRDGKLYEFSTYGIRVMRPWGPGAGAWLYEAETGRWRGCIPDLSIGAMERACRFARKQAGTLETLDEEGRAVSIPVPLAPSFAGRKALATEAFLSSIPAEVRRAVRPFAEGQWELLRLVDRCGTPFLDLLASNPALALALALRRRLAVPLARTADVSRLLRKRQRDVAGRLGFPPAESAVRTLRRVPAATLSFWRLYHLRVALGREDLSNRLRFAPRLNASVLRLLCDPAAAPLVTPAFVDEVARLRTETRSAGVARSVLELRDLHVALQRPRPPVVGSLRALERAHERAVLDLGRAPQRAALAGLYPFPPPPLPDADGIEAIRNADELWQEGRDMNSCAAGYAPLVASGRVFLYRITSPERATVSVERSPQGWRITQLRGPSNRAVSRATARKAAAWVESASSSEAEDESDSGQDADHWNPRDDQAF